MSRTEGWKQVYDFIQSNLNRINNRLDGTSGEIESLAELKGLQEGKKAYLSVLNFVERRIDIVEKS